MRKLLTALFLTLATPAMAEPETPHQVIAWMADRIYALGETSGGSPAEWRALDSEGVMRIVAAVEADPASVSRTNDAGRTPLHLAAFQGHSSLVAALMRFPDARKTMEIKDNGGLRPVDHALLAFKQSFAACSPRFWNDAFTFVPIMVVQPYYQQRDAYKRTMKTLINRGSKPDPEMIAAFWQSNCSGPQARLDPAPGAFDLQAQLIALGQAAFDAKFRQ